MSLCSWHCQVYISCQYWLINHTGLPLIFKQDGSSQEAAGQFEEHEIARSLQPLLFSYTEPELPEKYATLYCGLQFMCAVSAILLITNHFL